MADDKYLRILKEYWGYPDFRGIQRDIIESICAGKDTLGLMPTGGGKSITFQVPAIAMEGVCLVITPLIALMKDQVDALRKKGVKAYAIYGSMKHTEDSRQCRARWCHLIIYIPRKTVVRIVSQQTEPHDRELHNR